MYRADGRTSRPVCFCSRMWAAQPAVRAQVNIDVNMCGGTSAKSSTMAAQNSTLVASTRSGLRCLLQRLGDLGAGRPELLGRPPQHPGPRVLGPVHAVPETHQPVPAV